MEHGSVIGSVCYEKILPSGEKEHVRIGKLIYFRAHKEGGVPSCQFRFDMVPGVAWKKDPDTFFIANFIPSEKVPDAPYLCGKIYVTTNERGDHVEIGHINTRQREHNGDTQYYLQLAGVPIGEVLRQQRRAMLKAVELAYTTAALGDERQSGEVFMGNLNNLFDAKAKSVFCKIEVD